jgi:hypothetical protein
MREVIPRLLQLGLAGPWVAEDYMPPCCQADWPADAFRARSGVLRDRDQEAEYREAFTNARKALRPATWDREYRKGQAMIVEDAVIEAHRTQHTPT